MSRRLSPSHGPGPLMNINHPEPGFNLPDPRTAAAATIANLIIWSDINPPLLPPSICHTHMHTHTPVPTTAASVLHVRAEPASSPLTLDP